MLETRVIPCLQIVGNNLVKTVKYKKESYIGDPLNTCRIFNELEVDEMMILGIRNSIRREPPDFEFLQRITSECFMPLSYGGGIRTLEDAKRLFECGYEKVVLSSVLFDNLDIVTEIANVYGSQSVVASIDVKCHLGKYHIYSMSGTRKERVKLNDWISRVCSAGAGELLLSNISREGTWSGYDLDLIKNVTNQVTIPVIVLGGAGCKRDVEDAVNLGGASAVALGSMVVYQQKDMGVLVNYSHDYDFANAKKC